MEMILYHQERESSSAFENFLDLYLSSRMKFLASDLLKKGLSPSDINQAVRRAMTTCRLGGIEIRQHFMPVYTQASNGLVNDCKLTRLSYALVIINANVNAPFVANWQLRMIKEFLN